MTLRQFLRPSSTLLLTAVLAPVVGLAQWDLHFDPTVQVTRQGNTLDLAWAGGLNSPQTGTIDLNGDGLKDLFLFDRIGNKVVTLLRTSATGTQGYQLTRAYDDVWPFRELHDWALLRDYNCDGKEDIFSYSQAGFSVYKNISTSAGPAFELVSFRVNSNYVSPSGAGSVANLFISQVDLPGIADMDGDGDMDILTFSLLGSYVEYHRNLSMELYGTCDSLKYEVRNKCWGFFTENFNNNSVALNAPCNFNVPNPEIGLEPGGVARSMDDEGRPKAHAGSTLTQLDLNGDGLMDLLLGDISYQNVVGLYNGGSAAQSLMTVEDTLFPSYNTSVDLPLFPSTFFVDLDNDGNRDLLVSPNATSLTQNYRSMWYYRNTATDAAPYFEKQTEDLFQSRMIELGEGAYPVPFDHNGDGLMDLVVSNYGYYTPGDLYVSKMALLQNIGTATTPVFQQITDDYMNLSTSGIGLSMYPAFGDVDGDGDKDLLIGDLQGRMHFYRNTATGAVAQFQLVQPNVTDANGTVIDVGQFAAPQLVDMNNDQLLDLVIGERNGNLNFYLNTGSASAPVWTLQSETLGGVQVAEWWNVTGHAVPVIFRNEQGERELLCGSESGWLYHYTNVEGNLGGTWTLADSTFLDLNDGPKSAPCLFDFTGDGELDMVIGNYRGGLSFWRSDEVQTTLESNVQRPSFLLTPNPATDVVTILIGEAIPPTPWTLMDAVGRIVMTGKTQGQRTTVNISGLSEGSYLLWLDLPTGRATERLIRAIGSR
jgi:hypothetical protein